MGFGQGLSGLKAQAQKLDVIGNNIANAGTVGFKSSSVSFADVYASSRVGLGTQVAAVNQNFGIGNISSTGGQFDLAIDGDRGLFRVESPSGQVMYTRNGEFSVNKEGYLVNVQGSYLTALIGDGDIPQRIRVPYGNIEPKSTTTVDLQANFDANADIVVSGKLEQRGWIDLTNAGGATSRYYYKEETGGALGLYDEKGQPAVIAAGTYSSGEATGIIVADPPGGSPAGTPSTIGSIPNNAATLETPFPSGKEKMGVLLADDTTEYFFKIVDGEYKWFNADGTDSTSPPDETTTITSNGIDIAFTASGQPDTGNLPAEAKFEAYVPEQLAFDPLVPSTYTHSLPMTVYDSLGNAHQLTQYFVKREGDATGSNWNVFYRLDGNPIDNSVLDGTTRLEFDREGRLTYPAGPVQISFTLPDGESPAEPLMLSLDYNGSTQFGAGFSPDYLQNGYSTGEYSSLNFAADGSIVAAYTNGQTMQIGSIVLAHFNSLQGLQPVGGNAWIETSASGPAILGTPGSMGFAMLKGQALEESNVDMGTELVNMIITQRTYQANAQTITTQSEIMQTLMNIR